jgi:hypothetical protein
MPLAEWSGKGTVENQQHVDFTAKIGKTNRFTLEIGKGEIGGGGRDGDFRHIRYPWSRANWIVGNLYIYCLYII